MRSSTVNVANSEARVAGVRRLQLRAVRSVLRRHRTDAECSQGRRGSFCKKARAYAFSTSWDRASASWWQRPPPASSSVAGVGVAGFFEVGFGFGAIG